MMSKMILLRSQSKAKFFGILDEKRPIFSVLSGLFQRFLVLASNSDCLFIFLFFIFYLLVFFIFYFEGLPDVLTGVFHSWRLNKSMPNSRHVMFTMASHFLLIGTCQTCHDKHYCLVCYSHVRHVMISMTARHVMISMTVLCAIVTI